MLTNTALFAENWSLGESNGVEELLEAETIAQIAASGTVELCSIERIC